MSDSNEDPPKECYLINAGVSQFSDIEDIEQLADITILNLHCNKLSSLQGLPKFEYLTELNLSSNEFKDVNISELVHLPNLLHLDMSGNYLNKLDNLPYLPSLETFSVAFNNISTLNGLDGFPALQNLDIRGNLLAAVESFSSIQVLSSLRNIQLSSLDGRHANPICGHDKEIICVFDSFFYLGSIDKKSRQEYANCLTEKTFGFVQQDARPLITNSHQQNQQPADQILDMSSIGKQPNDVIGHQLNSETHELTPKFDQAVERFRHRMLEKSAPSSKQNPTGPGTIGGVVVYEDDSSEEERVEEVEEYEELNAQVTKNDFMDITGSASSSPQMQLQFPASSMAKRKGKENSSSSSPPQPSSLSPRNPWKDEKEKQKRKHEQEETKTTRAQRILQKRNMIAASILPVPSRPINDIIFSNNHDSVLNVEQVQVSSGDDDTDTDASISHSRQLSDDILYRKQQATQFIQNLFLIVSNNQSHSQVLHHVWQTWAYKTVISRQQEQILSSEETNSLLLLKVARAEADALESKDHEKSQISALQKELLDEQNRNSALQDRLMALEHEQKLRTAEHVAAQEALTVKLEAQTEMTKETQAVLSQQETRYSESLQSITSDVVQFTKVIEGKDLTIAGLQAKKELMDSEIKHLQNEVKDLTSAREQYICQDCTKIKSFFDTMQRDMQHLVEQKVQLEHENKQIPSLTLQLSELKDKLTKTQLDLTQQISEMQQSSLSLVSRDTLVELEAKHAQELKDKNTALEAKDAMVQDCLQELASAKDGLMEYDDKCVELEKLLEESSAKQNGSKNVVSELERARLDIRKHISEALKKDKLISEMREHVLEVKTMLKKLADKCHALEYANKTQHLDIIEAHAELKRLECELTAANEAKSALEKQQDSIVSAGILLSQKNLDSSSDSGSMHSNQQQDSSNRKYSSGDKKMDGGVVSPSVECEKEGEHEGGDRDEHRQDNRMQHAEDMVSRVMFEELIQDFDQLQGDYDMQAQRLHELESQLHEQSLTQEEEEHEKEKEREGEGQDNELLIDGLYMTPKEIHAAYLHQKTEHDEQLKDMTVSLRIKDKMIDDQNNAIRRLKERHRDDESRVQETITLLEDENEEIRNELVQLEEQLEQSREQEKHCLNELRAMEQDRKAYQDKCKQQANEEIKPYRIAIQDKDDALEKARTELTSICDVVAEMQAQGLKKDQELKHLKKKVETISEEVGIETKKYLKEKAAKANLLKDVQKMRAEISQSLINKEDIIKDLKKSLKNKKILLLEAHEKILHMEQLFGTFQQLAATLSTPSFNRHAPTQPHHPHQHSHQRNASRPVSIVKGEYSLPVPSHLMLTKGALAQTIENYNNSNKELKESISDMSVVSSDSDGSNKNDNKNDIEDENFIRRHESKSPDRSHISSHQKKKHHMSHPYSPSPPANTDGFSLAMHRPDSASLHFSSSSPPSRQHVAGRSYTDLELSATNSANILASGMSDHE